MFLRWLKILFVQKPLTKDTAQMALFLVFNESATATKDTAQMALFLVFNESATAEIALCTYLKLTLNGNFVG